MEKPIRKIEHGFPSLDDMKDRRETVGTWDLTTGAVPAQRKAKKKIERSDVDSGYCDDEKNEERIGSGRKIS